MTVRTYKFCDDCFSYQHEDVTTCVVFECRGKNLSRIFIQTSESIISLRKIRRTRKEIRQRHSETYFYGVPFSEIMKDVPYKEV